MCDSLHWHGTAGQVCGEGGGGHRSGPAGSGNRIQCYISPGSSCQGLRWCVIIFHKLQACELQDQNRKDVYGGRLLSKRDPRTIFGDEWTSSICRNHRWRTWLQLSFSSSFAPPGLRWLFKQPKCQLQGMSKRAVYSFWPVLQ